MLRYLVERIVLLLAGLFLTTLLIFFTLRVLPGDIAQVLGGTTASPEQIGRLRADLGLDRPLPVLYGEWVWGLLRGDLGTSLLTGTPVAQDIAHRIDVTLPLTLMAMVIALIIAVPFGVMAGLSHDRFAGTAINVTAQGLAAVPVLWAGLLLILLFGRGAGLIGILPSTGFPQNGWADPVAAFQALILPAATIGIVEGAVLLRFVRSGVLEAMNQDFVRTAAAKGLTRVRALITHGLPTVGLAILTVSALQLAALVTGAVLSETLFNLPGVGRMLVADVGTRDLTKVQSTVFLMTALVLVLGTLLDVTGRVLDPRQRRVVA